MGPAWGGGGGGGGVIPHPCWFRNMQANIRCWFYMMSSSNGNAFRVTGHLCREFTGPRWIPLTKASDAELWCFLWSAPEYNRENSDLRRYGAHYDAIVMKRSIFNCKLNGLMQKLRNSSGKAIELRIFCIQPSKAKGSFVRRAKRGTWLPKTTKQLTMTEVNLIQTVPSLMFFNCKIH